MNTAYSHRGSGSELRAFLSFYGMAAAGTILLHAILATFLPTALLAEHNASAWALSFLVSCSVCAWVFERHRQHAHS